MTKILIAEDDKFLANAYRLKLTKSGFDLRIVSNGEDALKELETFTPDVILLDIVMPKLDGFAVLKQIKSSEMHKNIPVIVASNLGQKEDIDLGKSLGAVDYIVKTDLSMEDLVDKLNTISGSNIK